MGEAVITSSKPRRVVVRSVALPSEHGGWGFLFEPILLGLLVAFSWRGVLLAIAAAGVFLLHQPVKIALKDRLKRRRPPRAVLAERFVIAYAALAFVPIAVLLSSSPLLFLLPIALAIPFAAIQLYYDSRNRSRQLIPEVGGAVALAMIAPSIAVLGGWSLGRALLLWAILAIRAVVVILYVRARIRLKIGKPASPRIAWAAHVVATVVIAGFAGVGWIPWLAVGAFSVLLVRASLGLSRYRKDRPIKQIGYQELAYGLVTVTIVALGYLVQL